MINIWGHHRCSPNVWVIMVEKVQYFMSASLGKNEGEKAPFFTLLSLLVIDHNCFLFIIIVLSHLFIYLFIIIVLPRIFFPCGTPWRLEWEWGSSSHTTRLCSLLKTLEAGEGDGSVNAVLVMQASSLNRSTSPQHSHKSLNVGCSLITPVLMGRKKRQMLGLAREVSFKFREKLHLKKKGGGNRTCFGCHMFPFNGWVHAPPLPLLPSH